MPKCDGLLVNMQDGWADSIGLNAEMIYFDAHEKPVAYLGADFWSDPVELERTLMRIEWSKKMEEVG